MAISNATELTSMLGQHIHFTNVIPTDYGPDFAEVSGSVLAVLVPAPGSDVWMSLLVRQDGYQEPEYYRTDEMWFSTSGETVGAGPISRS